LTAEGQACLNLEQRDKDGKFPYAQQIKSYESKGLAIPADLQAKIDAENAREAALYAAFVRKVERVFRLPREVTALADRDNPVTGPVTSTTEKRSAALLHRVINQFDVENNPRYLSDTHTYCNVFARDVMHGMGADLPAGKNANAINNWLNDDKGGKKERWRKVSAQEAQTAYANKGKPALASWKNSGTDTKGNPLHGHLAVLRPGTYTKEKGPAIAQAGGKNKNFNSTHVRERYPNGLDRFAGNAPEYWVHD
jgi:hypothetical protein